MVLDRTSIDILIHPIGNEAGCNLPASNAALDIQNNIGLCALEAISRLGRSGQRRRPQPAG
jgi:hypothetical protein